MRAPISKCLLIGTCMLAVASAARAQEAAFPGGEPPAAAGQEAQPPSPDTVEQTDGDIIVVAQRREERLRDVPASIAAVGAAQLQATTSQRVQDIANYVPNLNVLANSGGGTVVTIRGVGSDSRNIGFDSRAGVYVDGVYLGQSPALDQDLLGLARVEVLRGPQGSLFGKNTVAGAINLITERPGQEFGGEVFARLGNLDFRQFSGRVYGPLTDTLSASLSASTIDRDGYVRNLNDDVRFPTRDSTSVRGQLAFNGGGPLTVYLAADAMIARDKRNSGDALTTAFGTSLNTDAPGRNVTNYTRISDDERDTYGLSAEVAYELSNGMVLKSITAYRDTSYETTFDAERNLIDLLYVNYVDGYKQTSEELQLISPAGGPLQYLGGLFFYRQDGETRRDALGGASSALLGVAPGRGTISGGEVLTTNFAVFGNASYDITDQLEVSVGGRYSHEKKRVDWSIDGSAAPAFNIATGRITDSRTDEDFSPTATLTYRVTPQVNVYARYSTGYKSGGYNLDFITRDVFPTGIEFDKETVDNYEAGLKGAFLGGAATFNLSAFIADYSDYQVNRYRDLGGGRTAIVISNAGSVRTKGIEAEATLRASSALSFSGGLGILDAEFTDFPDGGPAGENLRGNRLPLASRFQGTIGADLNQPLTSGLSLVSSARYSYRSAYFSDVNNVRTQRVSATTTIPWGRIPGYGLADARIGVRGAAGWEVSLWSRNLTDESYVNSYTREFLGTLIETRAEPRTWGAEARVRF